MSYPKTAAEWWALFVNNRDHLRQLAARFYPVGAKSSPDVPITAPGAERECETARADIAATGMPLLPALALIADAQAPSVELVEVLSAVWVGLPESESVRALPGFFALCDLCSESDLVCPVAEE